jgi:hypothetical protein
MLSDNKLAPLRKGLLEFLVLKICSARSVYSADILRRLAETEFATQEGSGRNQTRVRHASITNSLTAAANKSARWIITGTDSITRLPT